jgi:hypothetical protein
MSEEDPPSVEERVLEAFAPLAASRDSALRRVLMWGLDYALFQKLPDVPAHILEADLTFQFVFDQRALFNAIIADGIWNSEAGSSSLWLVQWLDAKGINVEALISEGGRERNRVLSDRKQYGSGHSNLEVVLTKSLAQEIIPATVQLARYTEARGQTHLRHLTFALITMCHIGWFGSAFTAKMREELKEDLADRNSKTYPVEAEGWKRVPSAFPFPSEDRRAEFVPTLADAPALIDSLGRQVFAEVLAGRIKEVARSFSAKSRADINAEDRAFMLHMDGPWGSGKSSVLNFLRGDLESSGWLVVEFNAWRNQHRRPAWLPLILQARSAAVHQLSPWSPLVWVVWLWWRLRMDWMPYLFAILLIAVAGLLAWWSGLGVKSNPLQDASEALKALGAIIAATISLLAVARGFALGSQRNAEAYLETKSEPFRRIIRLFEKLVLAVHRPVAVFIDDLDRCDGSYVIDLLEGIQTSLRAAPIVYVVAGDRKWICSSFEKRYADFCGEIGTPGRPLGYLFLDKVFQLSTSLPQLSARRQSHYWRELLERGDSNSPGARLERQRLEKEASVSLKGKTQHEDIQRVIEKTVDGSPEREAIIAAAAKQVTSPEALRATEHRLQPLAHLLESNPRSMKRLVNAYGLNHARAFLEGRNVSVEALARWTIIELRWPLLAEHFAHNWPEISRGALAPRDFSDSIRTLLSNAEVRAVIGTPKDVGHLTVEALDPILD